MSLLSNRFLAIKRIISSNAISSQEDLLHLLEKEGYEITQATLSRDLKKLQIVKAPNEKGLYIYSLRNPSEEFLEFDTNVTRFLSNNGLVTIEFSYNMAVLKTRPGHASAIAYQIDKGAMNIILGTIAGDDTLLLIPREGVSRDQVIDVLEDLFEIKS